MAIEDDNSEGQEIWRTITRHRYNKAIDTNPAMGRLYHPLVTIAKLAAWKQLSLYTRSLTGAIPYEAARKTLLLSFELILNSSDSSIATAFVRAHVLYFRSQVSDSHGSLRGGSSFGSFIAQSGSKFKADGAFTATSNIAMLFDYGPSRLRYGFEKAGASNNPKHASAIKVFNSLTLSSSEAGLIVQPCRLIFFVLDLALKRSRDENILPLVHVY